MKQHKDLLKRRLDRPHRRHVIEVVVCIGAALSMQACSYWNVKAWEREKVAEERRRAQAVVAPLPTVAEPAGGQGAGGNPSGSRAEDPLNDPNNLLSKRSVFFDFGATAVKDEYMDMLKAHAQYLQQHPDARVTLQGNSDERGSHKAGVEAANRRAQSVKAALENLGAPANQMQTVSFGDDKPLATGHGESAWHQNRRVDIVYDREK